VGIVTVIAGRARTINSTATPFAATLAAARESGAREYQHLLQLLQDYPEISDEVNEIRETEELDVGIDLRGRCHQRCNSSAGVQELDQHLEGRKSVLF
jgi:hypothetical protein